MLPESKHIRRCIFLWHGCSLSGKVGTVKRCGAGYNRIGGVHSIFIRIGYQDCVGHFGTTTIPVALSCLIFCKTDRIQLKGGKQ